MPTCKAKIQCDTSDFKSAIRKLTQIEPKLSERQKAAILLNPKKLFHIGNGRRVRNGYVTKLVPSPWLTRFLRTHGQ